MSTGTRPATSDTRPASGSTTTYPSRKPVTIGRRPGQLVDAEADTGHDLGEGEHDDVRVGGAEQHGASAGGREPQRPACAGRGRRQVRLPAVSAGRSTDVDLLAVACRARPCTCSAAPAVKNGPGQGGLAELAGGLVDAEDRGHRLASASVVVSTCATAAPGICAATCRSTSAPRRFSPAKRGDRSRPTAGRPGRPAGASSVPGSWTPELPGVRPWTRRPEELRPDGAGHRDDLDAELLAGDERRRGCR